MKLVYTNGSDVRPDDQLTNGYMGTHVTVVKIASPPYEDENGYDDGSVIIRESWGEQSAVPVGRLRPCVSIRLEPGDEGY